MLPVVGAVLTRGVLVPRCPVTEVPRLVEDRLGVVTVAGAVRDRLAGVPVVTRWGDVLRDRVLVTCVLRVGATARLDVARVASTPLTEEARVDLDTSFVRGSSARP